MDRLALVHHGGRTNCREIVDNVVDMAHFFYVHGSMPTHFKNVFEGHVATQYTSSGSRPDLPSPEGGPVLLGTTSLASYWGPSFMIDDLTYQYEHEDQQTVLLNCHHPIDANLCAAVRHHRQEVRTTFRRRRRCRRRRTRGLRQDGIRTGRRDLAKQDAYRNPLLCEEDGPVYQLRRWYE